MRALFWTLSCFLLLARAGATVTYSKLFSTGSYSATTVYAMTSDASGNSYFVGTTNGIDFPTTPGVIQPALKLNQCSFIFDPHSPPIVRNCFDLFVVKLDAAGNVVFATYLGGSGDDYPSSIAVDSAGNIYISGETNTTNPPSDFPVTPGAAYQPDPTSKFAAFVVKLNPQGTALIYSTFIPALSSGALAVDAAGNAYVGSSALPAEGKFVTTPGAFQTSGTAGHSHGTVTKLNAAGSAIVYSTFLGGSRDDRVQAIAVDGAGNAYLTGTTSSTDFPVTSGAFLSVNPAAFSAGYVTKLNAAGSALIYSSYLPGGDLEAGTQIRVDGSGDALVLTESIKVLKLNPQGAALLYSVPFKGAAAIDIDSRGNAYVAGAQGAGFAATPGAAQRCANGGGTDVVLAQLDGAGNVAAASYLGGSGHDSPVAISAALAGTTGASGTVFVAGSTTSNDFPGAARDLQGRTAVFASKLRIADPSQPDAPCLALGVQNGASFVEGPIAPGELITLRGVGFGPDQGVVVSPLGAHFTEQTSGVRVLFDGVPAPLLYVQSTQINVQAPFELSGRAATTIQVEYQGQLSNNAPVQVVDTAPGLFLQRFDANFVAALNSDLTPVTTANPAKRGGLIAVFGTGGGVTTPISNTGFLSPIAPLFLRAQPVTAKIGSVDAQVQYAGVAPTLPTGVFQINIIIPDVFYLTGNQTVSVRIGGADSQVFALTVPIQ